MPSGGNVAIQIGAFSSEAEARRHLDAVRTRTAGMLDRYQPTTVPHTASGRQLYRARFTGFDGTAAANACLELRRRQVDCYVMRVE
jgi:D-alanyl-D-alanine carboxypeptidase